MSITKREIRSLYDNWFRASRSECELIPDDNVRDEFVYLHENVPALLVSDECRRIADML